MKQFAHAVKLMNGILLDWSAEVAHRGHG